MRFAVLARIECTPGNRDKVFQELTSIVDLSREEPEPESIVTGFTQPLLSHNYNFMGDKDALYIFERFSSAEARKTGCPKSSPALQAKLQEWIAAKPQLVTRMPYISELEERYAQFNFEGEDMKEYKDSHVKVTRIDCAPEDAGKQITKMTAEVQETLLEAKDCLFGGVYFGNSLINKDKPVACKYEIWSDKPRTDKGSTSILSVYSNRGHLAMTMNFTLSWSKGYLKKLPAALS